MNRDEIQIIKVQEIVIGAIQEVRIFLLQNFRYHLADQRPHLIVWFVTAHLFPTQ